MVTLATIQDIAEWMNENLHRDIKIKDVAERSDSTDNGKTWCEAQPTSLPNNNSGIDLVRTPSGVLVLAWNPVGGNWGQRYPISLSVSTDNGESWAEPVDLENEQGEFSYPAIISDGDVIHLTYTWNRKNIVYYRFQITC